MKIIQITPYYAPHIGGMENYVRAISEKLVKKGHQIEVFTSDIDFIGEKNNSEVDLKIHRLMSWEFAHTAIIPSLFFRLLNISKDSIIHLHIASAFTPEVAYLISKVRNVSYIAHVHADVEPTGKMGFLLPFYKNIILKKILNSASKVVVPTEDYANLVNKKYSIPKNKIVVIPCGINLNNFRKVSVKLHNPIRLLFVGRLSKEKNFPLMIKTLKKVVDEYHYNIKLHIVGDGEEKNNIQKLIKGNHLENDVILHGVKTGNELIGVYSSSDVFILPSVYESFGIVLIEAMSFGLPIVASNIPGLRNVVQNEKNGLLVKQTPEDFAIAIEKLITNFQLREKIIKNCLKEVKKYNWGKVVTSFEFIYKNVLYENSKK